jgi:hypothetical protein
MGAALANGDTQWDSLTTVKYQKASVDGGVPGTSAIDATVERDSSLGRKRYDEEGSVPTGCNRSRRRAPNVYNMRRCRAPGGVVELTLDMGGLAAQCTRGAKCEVCR